jgi:WhiB family redox-sensing transcriptional regulator
MHDERSYRFACGQMGGVDEPADWRALGECLQLDPEAFFPDPGASSAAALSACARCVVRDRCLEWALENDIRFGIWGGLTEDERRALRKADSASPVSASERVAP